MRIVALSGVTVEFDFGKVARRTRARHEAHIAETARHIDVGVGHVPRRRLVVANHIDRHSVREIRLICALNHSKLQLIGAHLARSKANASDHMRLTEVEPHPRAVVVPLIAGYIGFEVCIEITVESHLLRILSGSCISHGIAAKLSTDNSSRKLHITGKANSCHQQPHCKHSCPSHLDKIFTKISNPHRKTKIHTPKSKSEM